MGERIEEILTGLRTIVILLTCILIFQFINTCQNVTKVNANSRWSDVNIAAVGGDAVYGSIPTK